MSYDQTFNRQTEITILYKGCNLYIVFMYWFRVPSGVNLVLISFNLINFFYQVNKAKEHLIILLQREQENSGARRRLLNS